MEPANLAAILFRNNNNSKKSIA